MELEAALLPSQHDALCDVNTVEVNEHMQCVGNVLVPQVPGSIPFDLMTVENLTLSDGAAKPLASTCSTNITTSFTMTAVRCWRDAAVLFSVVSWRSRMRHAYHAYHSACCVILQFHWTACLALHVWNQLTT